MNKYQIKQKLGVGNFAEVFRCIHKQTKNQYAIKKIKININQNEIMIYDSLKNTENVNVVKGIESFMDQGSKYIVMEYCANGSLDDYLKKHIKFSERQASIIIYFTTKGLKTLHQNNIIHRDLKAANILFDKQFNVKINDFGLSKLIQYFEQLMKSRVGTPLYMSPQLLQYQTYTNKTDTWSIGVLMYLLLTQKYPFYKMGQNEVQLKANVRKQKLQFDESMSNEAKQFIKKCLESDETKRINVNQILEQKYLQKIRLDEQSAKKELFQFLSKHNQKNNNKVYEHILFEILKKIESKLKLFNNPNINQLLQSFNNENLQKYHKQLVNIITYNIASNCQVKINKKKLSGLNIIQLLKQNTELIKKSFENKQYSNTEINLILIRFLRQIFAISQNQIEKNIKKNFVAYIAQFMDFPLSFIINITMADVPQLITSQNLNKFQPVEHNSKMIVQMEQVNIIQQNKQRIMNIINFLNSE